MDRILTEAVDFLKKLSAPWAICGGYALDLFLGKTIREHGDIDICVFPEDRGDVVRFMQQDGWTVYEFCGMGKVHRLAANEESTPGRNLMCLKETCRLVEFFPCEEEGRQYYLFHHDGMDGLNYIEFLFGAGAQGDFAFEGRSDITRPMDKAILRRDGVPFLAPELALLYKSRNADNEAYQLDFRETLPKMDDEQRKWFENGMKRLYPEGHDWISR